MRKESKNGGAGALGKAVAKSDLPSKACVVCHRPFTWRKKWEKVWEEVTTCSKSCNAKRKSMMKKQQQGATTTESTISSSTSEEEDSNTLDPAPAMTMTKKMLRQQHKEAVKAAKRDRRAKRTGNAPEAGRKPCDLCQREVDLLVRCTVDESKRYQMVCGKCWPKVSGGVPDGLPEYPHYTYGGLWKNRNANLKKKVGSGPASASSAESISSMLDQLEIGEGEVRLE